MIISPNSDEPDSMSIKRKRFIVLTLGDTEAHSYDENTMPMLLRLVDSSKPDYRMFTHIGVVANYLTSPRALQAVEDVITQAEKLRDTDPRFARIGIGLAEGELFADFDWRGRLKTDRHRPSGAALTAAVHIEREPQRYRQILGDLRKTIESIQ